MLGDLLSKALAAAGVTEERVSWFLGRKCRCAERREALNTWARMYLAGLTTKDELEEVLHADRSDRGRDSRQSNS